MFDNHEAMIEFLNSVMGQEETINRQMNLQKKAAMSEEISVYAELLK